MNPDKDHEPDDGDEGQDYDADAETTARQQRRSPRDRQIRHPRRDR